MHDALEVAKACLQRIVGVGLQSVDNVHVWRCRSHADNLYDALSVGVLHVVDADEGVALSYHRLRGSVLHEGRRKVVERHPRQHVLTFALASVVLYYKLIPLGNVGSLRGVIRKTLYHDVVTRAERVVSLSVVGIEIYLTRRGVVVVYLEHSREDAVVVLSDELADYHLVDLHTAAHDKIVELRRPFLFRHSCGVYHLARCDAPALTSEEARDEVAVGHRALCHEFVRDGT